MKLAVDSGGATFIERGSVVGRYVIDDPYKPHIHPLNTPAGHTVSLAMPHDHPHHKGLMYALRTTGVNFWEERTNLPGEVIGRQIHESFENVVAEADEVGFEEWLRWEPVSGDIVFKERRRIQCRLTDDGRAYMWSWMAELRPAVDVELIKSQWSLPNSAGVSVNYHGLGIRLRRDFGCTGGNELLLDGEPVSFADGLGLRPRLVEFRGSMDGMEVVSRASVGVGQESSHGLFVMDSPFAFMALGPSNLEPLILSKRDILRESFSIIVSDL